MQLRLLVLLLAVAAGWSRAETPPLLAEAAARWEKDRHGWAFTQRVREWDGTKLLTERVESYDPNRGTHRRWKLLEVRGRAPTRREAEALERRKNRPPRHAPKPITSWVDLANARVVAEDDQRVDYQLPLRTGADLLFPEEKIEVIVTLNKRTREIERARAGIEEPFRVALGLARIIDLELDLALPAVDGTGATGPHPAGNAHAVVNRFGRRIEYFWSDFRRGPASIGWLKR